MSSNDITIQHVENSPMAIANVGGNMTGDIVAGNKTIINNIIQQAAKQIVAAPYKFLASYDISDRDIFFGRDAVIEELLGKLPRSKALVINGRSGAGKTSLINAGLIPRLTDNGYHFISFREYRDPLAQWRDYVAQHDLFRPFAGDMRSLAHFLNIATRQQKMRLAVIFDQFERFFVNVPASLRTQFILEVKTCLDSDLTGAELDLVFALREDFFGAFVSEFETAIPTFFHDADRFNLLPLRPENAREAIIRPLKNLPVHLGYDPHFVDDVLLPGLIGASEGEARIDPPNLQIVCNQLYEKARERHAADLEMGSVVQIGRQLYEELGATRGILSGYLDDFIARVAHRDPNGRDALRSMLKLMTETTGTRKFVSLADLTRGLPDVPSADIERHLRACQDGRIIEARGEGNDARYSLSHDVMVAKVQSWSDKREFQRMRARETLDRGMKEWTSNQTLLNARQIRLIRAWLPDSFHPQEQQLINESVRGQRIKKIVLGGALCIIFAILSGLFYLLPSRSYYFRVDAASRQIELMRGHPGVNLGILGFPQRIMQTSYTSDQIDEEQSDKLSVPFYKQHEWETRLIPILQLPEQGAAYERRGEIEQAINVSIHVIDTRPHTLQYQEEREDAALRLIRLNAPEALQQKAATTLQEVGRGNALRELTRLIANAETPPFAQHTAAEVSTIPSI